MNDFRVKSGFSNLDNQIVHFLGERLTLIKPNNDCNKNNSISSNKNKKITIRKMILSTNDKLNQIIYNLEKKNKNIREKFLDYERSKLNEYNSFHMKIQQLIKHNKIAEKKEKKAKNERLNGIHESIQRLLNHKKKYALNEKTKQLKIKDNYITPSIYKYNPNFLSINKHIPVPDLSEHHSKIITNKNITKNITNKNNKNKFRAIKSCCSILNSNKYKKIIDKLNKKGNKNKKRKNNHNSMHLIDSKFIKIEDSDNYNKYNIVVNKKKYIPQSNSMDLITLNPDKKKSFISIPNFNKMTSRDKNNYFLYNNKYLGDYSHNYNAIYSNANKFFSFNKDLKEKKNKLRKILSSSNPPKHYLLLPSLNSSII
jgi:hypothetical protein